MSEDKSFIDEIIAMFWEERARSIYKDCTLNDFLSVVQSIKNDIVTFNNEAMYVNDFIPYFQAKVKSKLNIDFLGVSAPFIIIKTSASVQDIAKAFDIDETCIKSLPLPSTSINLILIDVSELNNDNPIQKDDESSTPLNLELLDFIHEIGVKYINCEYLDEDYLKNKKQLIEKIDETLGRIDNSQVGIDIKDYDIYITVYAHLEKDEICYALGLNPDLFMYVANPFESVLICSCPRVVFEEFYDKNEFDKAKGANKWLI